ncbi:MAG: glycoside hydrolase domain-containing protein [Actinomycetota bacterium]
MSVDAVDPFVGTDVTDLPSPEGIAATWWWPKPPVGNTHPGATFPLGMSSACAYSGAYPTGYGVYDLETEGVPAAIHDRIVASGFTHFQQSGTGAIRKYYNYVRVTPMLEPIESLGTTWPLRKESAEPGYYAATLHSGIRAELTVGPKSAVHRYTYPAAPDARLVIDLSHGGLLIDYGATVPTRAHMSLLEPGVAHGEVTVEGAPLAVHIEWDPQEWRQMLWYDRRLIPGATRLDFDAIRSTTLRPFGLILRGPTEPGQSIEMRIGFSLRGVDQAKRNLRVDTIAPADDTSTFDQRRRATRQQWAEHLDAVRVEPTSGEQHGVFSTALYHSLIKPCFASDESPFWPGPGPFVFDICTMWDIYRTQLPLLTMVAPHRAVELANALIQVCEEEGNLPIGYRMARGADRFSRQASALAHTFLADICALGLPGVDWEWALVHMHADLRRNYGEDFLEHGVVHPISHTLDLAMGYHCTAQVARHVGDQRLAAELDGIADQWRNAFEPTSALLFDSTFYEGGRWNYSFRLLHDMAARIALAGGDEAFVTQLDEFFGFGASPVKQPGRHPGPTELAEGYALNRFQGLNNEPDMEAPFAYHYAGRPDRTAEVVHAVVTQQFGPGRGGLPGNDDSGGLSSWYVWAALGLFPAAGQSTVLVSTPSFPHARLHIGDARFTITTTGFVEPDPEAGPQYIQSASLDGAPLVGASFSLQQLHRGGELHLDLGPEPSGWGSIERPPSHSITDPRQPTARTE